jgi:HK97 family phage major capsid protein
MSDKIIKMLEPGDIDVREINEKTRTIWHRISKEVKDRMGDIVRIDGIDTKNFRKKPTVLYGHNYSGLDPIPVIGSNVGFRKEGKSYYAGTRFLNPEEEKFSGKLADLVNDAWVLSRMKLIGWSIGFIPKETVPLKEKVADTDEEVTTGLDFKKSELLEYSLVLIPANQEAVNDAISKGLVSKNVVSEFQEPPLLVDDLTADLDDDYAHDDAGFVTKPSKENHVCAVGKGDYDKYRSGSREHDGKTYTIRYGRKRGTDEWEDYEYFYSVDTWTAAEARSHCKSHDGTFEAATGEDTMPCPCSATIDDTGTSLPVDIKKAVLGPEIPQGGPVIKVSPKSTGGKTRMNARLLELIQKLKKGEALTAEEDAEFDTLFAESKDQKAAPVRKLEFSDAKSDIRPISSIMETPSRLLTPVEQELQSRMDDIYIVSSLLRTNPRNLKMWTDLREGTSALRKAMDTATATEGLEWVPTTLSAQLIEKYRLEARVAVLFDEIAMPRNPYELPTDLGDMTYYLMPESLTPEPSKTPTTKLTTGKKTLTSKKLRARSIWSEELDANSIIPILPRVKDTIAKSAALAVEDVIINGDTTAPHQDADVTDSRDHRKAWKGLRKLVVAGAFNDLGTFDKDTTRGLLVDMGKYGLIPSEVVWIAGVVSYNKLRGLTELLTVDKYGPAATILTGEVGRLYGSPVIVSEKIRENLNATGVYDGSVVDNTLLLAVNRRAWILGNDGGWKLTVDFDNDVDQYVLNVRFRKDFICIYPATDACVAVGYNVTV